MSELNQELEQIALKEEISVLPLRDVVVYPNMVIPLFVGRERSINALDLAMNGSKQIMLVAQKSPDMDAPGIDDVYHIGTLATVLQLLKLPDGTLKVLVEGSKRAKIIKANDAKGFFLAKVAPISQTFQQNDEEIEIITRSLISLFEQYAKLNRKIPPELMSTIAGIDDPSRLADTIAAHLTVKLADKQRILELIDLSERMEAIMVLLENEMDVLQIEKKIRGRVKQQMEKSQREYYLNEQMKAIQKELGDGGDGANDIDEIHDKLTKAGMPKEALKKANSELNKLKMMPPMSAEATVVRNYLDWLTTFPWKKRSKIRLDLAKAESVLEEDHYGLDKVKERITEYLAVQQRVKKLRGPILCLVGPPGVGKTSLGRSIARATGRKFTRMSLGGMRDEAEIRGHRRTYIGSMPGRIVQNIAKIGDKNPLFMLDELDKMSMDFRGDPSAALLEVLDPEQNHAFNDHYLEVDVDLSEVMFVATANSLNIPRPLLDRMEIIRIPGYTEGEKSAIAKRYLLSKQFKEHGLKDNELNITDGAIKAIIRNYTREAGVRNLEREIAKICRKVVKQVTVSKKKDNVIVSARNIDKYLGVKRYRYGRVEEHNEVGRVTGLAWTEVGGELLSIEASVIPGGGKLQHTGQLGEVMQESIKAAMTIVRSRASSIGIDVDFYKKNDVHIHVPEGATPKDGPSAGVGMCTALVSALTNNPIKANVAMTGEITLRGKVLAIGGLKEKLLAALQGGIDQVIIPDENVKDLVEMPANIKSKLTIKPVKWIDEVLEIALVNQLKPIAEKNATTATRKTRKKALEKTPSAEIRTH